MTNEIKATPIEFWIHKDDGFVIYENSSDNTSESYHVIEHSAYQSVCEKLKESERVREKYKLALEHIQDIAQEELSEEIKE